MDAPVPSDRSDLDTVGTGSHRASISDSGALLELSSILNASLDLDAILGNVLLTLMGNLLITRGIVLTGHGQWTYRIASMKGVAPGVLRDEYTLPVHWSGVIAVESIREHSDADVRAFAECCEECGIRTLAPMQLDDRMVGVIGLGARLRGGGLGDEERTFIASVAAIAASAVKNALVVAQLRDANRRLDSKIQEMNTLFELSREMNAIFDEQKILRVLSYALMGQMRALRFAVFTRDGDGALQPVLIKLPDFMPDAAHLASLSGIDSALTLTDRALAPPERWIAGHGIEVVIPMRSQNETLGLLCMGRRLGAAGYEAAEVDYLTALANLTVTALENTRLLRETLEKQQLEHDLSLARSIQKGLLPAHLPQLPGYVLAAANESSQQVGGDYYDVIPLDGSRTAFVIADVSGKGIPASLLMANVQAALRTIVPLGLSLPEATMRMNALVHANTAMDKFITLFWGVLDPETHTFEYVNAGHNPPYLVHADGSYEPLSEGGLILGILPDPPEYTSATVVLRPGDTVVSYTDGVNEAMSKDMEEFGDERLAELLVRHARDTADDIVSVLRSDILEFTRGAAQSDDITMLVVQRVQ